MSNRLSPLMGIQVEISHLLCKSCQKILKELEGEQRSAPALKNKVKRTKSEYRDVECAKADSLLAAMSPERKANLERILKAEDIQQEVLKWTDKYLVGWSDLLTDILMASAWIAADTYDEERGRFMTYLVPRWQSRTADFFRAGDPISLPSPTASMPEERLGRVPDIEDDLQVPPDAKMIMRETAKIASCLFGGDSEKTSILNALWHRGTWLCPFCTRRLIQASTTADHGTRAVRVASPVLLRVYDRRRMVMENKAWAANHTLN